MLSYLNRSIHWDFTIKIKLWDCVVISKSHELFLYNFHLIIGLSLPVVKRYNHFTHSLNHPFFHSLTHASTHSSVYAVTFVKCRLSSHLNLLSLLSQLLLNLYEITILFVILTWVLWFVVVKSIIFENLNKTERKTNSVFEDCYPSKA